MKKYIILDKSELKLIMGGFYSYCPETGFYNCTGDHPHMELSPIYDPDAPVNVPGPTMPPNEDDGNSPLIPFPPF